MSTVLDHYQVLNCSPTATQSQIRNAYKRAALATHPDRFPSSSPAAAEATKKFQAVSDAYYVLGDVKRRAAYDEQRKSAHGNPSSRSYFTSDKARQEAYQKEFMDAFEEMFRDAEFTSSQFGDSSADNNTAAAEETAPTSKFYTILTGAAASVVGFTIANIPGAIAGGAIGAKLGSIRDHKGKSVYEAFQELPQSERAKMLAALAQKVCISPEHGAL
ncbi:DnaJ domain-containing protein [Limtongia smithiae]|uniref:DnaJ domain-containing protein n=1 Tax=Limtongia smithiae TaxID=1125753 RepID=UPI0034CEE853